MLKLIGSYCTAFGLDCAAFLCGGYFEIRTRKVLGWIWPQFFVRVPWNCDVHSLLFPGWDVQLYLAALLHWHRTSVTTGIWSRLIYCKSEVNWRHQDIVLLRAFWFSLVELQLWYHPHTCRHMFYCSTWISCCWLKHTGFTQIPSIPTKSYSACDVCAFNSTSAFLSAVHE